MLAIRQRGSADAPFQDRLTLPFDQRQKSRLRVRLDSGIEAALMLERGGILRDGDRLVAEDGRVILVVAANEPVSTVTAADARRLMRGAYHLGNRHVPLQVGDGWLRLGQDHVLEHMLTGLGLAVRYEMVPFEPEAGAYGDGGRGSHDHDHAHSHGHDHGHHHHD